uniref:Uncharacterized protein n=1 Tax=Rhizophora mucronata TaxID=61149 RepID=A0A2P2IUE5_RHIMU
MIDTRMSFLISNSSPS